jgi:hypothetical protein
MPLVLADQAEWPSWVMAVDWTAIERRVEPGSPIFAVATTFRRPENRTELSPDEPA